MIVRPKPILNLYVVFLLPFQIILENQKNLLRLKSLNNHLSLLIINKDYWSFDMLIKRVLIRNSTLYTIVGVIMNDQNSQGIRKTALISFIRISTNSSFYNKNKFTFSLGMSHRITPINIILLRNQNLNLILLFIRNSSKGTHGVF